MNKTNLIFSFFNFVYLFCTFWYQTKKFSLFSENTRKYLSLISEHYKKDEKSDYSLQLSYDLLELKTLKERNIISAMSKRTSESFSITNLSYKSNWSSTSYLDIPTMLKQEQMQKTATKESDKIYRTPTKHRCDCTKTPPNSPA